MTRKQFLKPFAGIIIFSLMIISCYGCKGDIVTGNSLAPSFFGGYLESEAAVNMTLAALCYTAENNPNTAQIKDSLILQLSDSAYATGGRWKLAWGPGISPGRGNMMYVAVDTTSDTIYYAIAVRGTDWEFPSNIIEDMEIWKLAKYPFGGTDDSVAVGSLAGLDTLLATVDPVSGQSLETYLNNIPNGRLKMFITGHSLGGALATLLTAWFADKGFANKFALEAYTFASPTVGNASFAYHYNSILSASLNAQSHRVVNSKDLVPFGWAGLGNVVTYQIPTTVPVEIALVFDAIQIYLNAKGIKYKHVETQQPIGFLIPANCSGGSAIENYFCWVGFEHSKNNYLRLLHADTVKLQNVRNGIF
jgi:hypothetical protein